jgi:hypothetical protein
MLTRLNTEDTKSTEHTENPKKPLTARAEIELSRFSPCASVALCELCSENTAIPLRINAEMTR